MITISARINLFSGDAINLSDSANFTGNNISAPISNVIGSKKKGTNPFIIGTSVLGDGSTFSDGEDYFIGSELSDSVGDFANTYTLELSSSKSFKSFTIAFDTANSRHPKSIYVDGNLFSDDDAIFTVFNLADSNTHTITITNWNMPSAPLVITGIYIDLNIDVNRRNIISFNRATYDRGDLKLPSFGIISNSANLSFKDLDGEIRDYAEQLLLSSDLKVTVWINNTLTKKSQQIGEFQTKEWNYDNDNRSVSVSLKDGLEEWQEISVEPIEYFREDTISSQPEQSFKWFYDILWNITNSNGFKMQTFDDLDTKTKEILNNSYIKYPLLKSGSLWAQWQKLCEVCQLHIYKDDSGIIVCHYNEGN